MRRGAMISGLLVVAVLVTPATAVGECDGPFPSFQHAAPSARRIVIGQVVAVLPGPISPDGYTSRFTLRGWSVLDGDVPVEFDVRDVQSQPCAGYIVARQGDRIAIAFDGHDFTPPQVVNAVAWLQGAPPSFDGIEWTTVAAIYDLLGRVPPAVVPGTAPESNPNAGPDDFVVLRLALLGILAIVGVLVWRRVRPPGPVSR